MPAGMSPTSSGSFPVAGEVGSVAAGVRPWDGWRVLKTPATCSSPRGETEALRGRTLPHVTQQRSWLYAIRVQALAPH